MNKEMQKSEAIARMKQLNLHKNVIREFEDENILNVSEYTGFLYWLTDEQKEYVRAFEEEHDALVYHLIYNTTEFGRLLTFLYVSHYEDEWQDDRNDLENGYTLAYVKNLDDECCSEFGSVMFRPQYGGLVRIA